MYTPSGFEEGLDSAVEEIDLLETNVLHLNTGHLRSFFTPAEHLIPEDQDAISYSNAANQPTIACTSALFGQRLQKGQYIRTDFASMGFECKMTRVVEFHNCIGDIPFISFSAWRQKERILVTPNG